MFFSTTGLIVLLVITTVVVGVSVALAVQMKSYSLGIALVGSFLLILVVILALYKGGIITL